MASSRLMSNIFYMIGARVSLAVPSATGRYVNGSVRPRTTKTTKTRRGKPATVSIKRRGRSARPAQPGADQFAQGFVGVQFLQRVVAHPPESLVFFRAAGEHHLVAAHQVYPVALRVDVA